jgi:HD superfamily phosphohydrolase
MSMRNDAWAALREHFSEPVRDALWGHIYLTPDMAALTTSPAFMRLTRIMQLGPAYGVYPGATHTRAVHSLGVYYLSRRLLLSLAERGAIAWISAQGVRSFLCASLLHDVGHFPYTHSLKELPLRSHESLTGDLIREEPLRSLVANTGADPYFTAAIVDSNLPDAGNGELRFYRKLLSGVLDPDKLDYLTRDARYCGVPYGVQDVDFILSRFQPHLERGVDIDSRGIPCVESLLFSKYLMYRTVYWHRFVRSATAMIKKALLEGLREGSVSKEKLYGLDDSGLFELLSEEVLPIFSLARKVRNGQLYTAAVEFPFDKDRHSPLLDIENRFRHEEALAAELSLAAGRRIPAAELIIDVPEPVSFETDLYITDESCYFGDSSGIFKAEVLNSFEKSLRIVRIFVDSAHEYHVKLYREVVTKLKF